MTTTVEALNATVTALKCSISDYHLRCKLAEEAAALLTRDLPKDELMQMFHQLAFTQSEQRSKERLLHYKAVLESMQIALRGLRAKTEQQAPDLASDVRRLEEALALALLSESSK